MSEGPYPVAFADLDGDGKPELVAGDNLNGNPLSVLRNTSTSGSITFGSVQTFTNPSTAETGITFADVDGDGKLDVLAGTINNGFLVYLNTSSLGSVSLATASTIASGTRTHAIASADIDNDGKNDVVIGTDTNVLVYQNQCSPPLASTTTALASSSAGNTSTYGDNVTLTATVSATGTPGGSVTFKDGSTTLGTGTLSSGHATYSTSALNAGSHSLTAVYAGDSSYATSTSSGLTQTVNKAPLSVTPADATRTYGAANLSFTPVYAGFVNGQNSSVLSGTPSLTTAATSSTPVGTATISAAAGTLTSSNYTFTYNSGQLTISKAPLTVTAQNASRVYGAADPAFSATISGYVNGESAITSGVTGAPSLSTAATTNSVVGSYAITPSLGTLAATNYSFTFANGALTISQAATSISVSSTSASNQSTYGEAVTFSASVTLTSGSGSPTGLVTFKDGATSLGSQSLDGSGQATYTTSSTALGGGVHTITAVYAGDTNFSGSTSSSIGQTVIKATQSITFAALSDKSLADSPATLGATASSGLTPTFSSSTTAVCTVSGTALTLVDRGTCTVTAAQAGNTNYEAAADVPRSFTVRAPQTITFAAPTPATYGDAPVALMATASSSLDVTFASTTQAICTTSGSNGTALTFVGAGNCSVTASQAGDATYLAAPDVSRQLSVAAAPLSIQANDATRVYGESNPSFTVTYTGFVNGDTSSVLTGALTFSTPAILSSAPSTYAITPSGLTSTNYAVTYVAGQLTVHKASSGTVLTPSTTTPRNGEVVGLDAQVSAVAPGGGTPAGLVTFLDGSTVLGTATLNGSGHASVSTAVLLDGNAHSVIATYAGDTNFAASNSGAVTLAIGQAATEVDLLVSAAPETVYDTPVTFTAQVTVLTPGAGTPTGAISFRDGPATLGSGSLDGFGHATFTTGADQLSSGTHILSAQFGGTSALASSVSSDLSLLVDPATTATALSATPGSSVVGESISLVAEIASTPAVTAGTVSFNDGATALGTATVGTDGRATLTASTLDAGSHSLTATFSGTSNFSASTSSNVDESISPATTTTFISASPASITEGGAVSLETWVSAIAPGTGTPSGTVSFLDGTTAVGSASLDGGGHASGSIATLAPGTHLLSVSYMGSSNYSASTSAATSVIVNPAPSHASHAPASGGNAATQNPAPVVSGPAGGNGSTGAPAPAPVATNPSPTTTVQPTSTTSQLPPESKQLADVLPAQSVRPEAIPGGILLEVHTQARANADTNAAISEAQQGSLGGGNAVQLSDPVQLSLVARDRASGVQAALPEGVDSQNFLVSLPVLMQATEADKTFAWLVEVQEDGQFLGYMRFPSTLAADSQSLIYLLPGSVLQHSAVLPVLLQKSYVQSFQPEVHIWTSPFKAGEDLGVPGPLWSTFEVVAPQVGSRIGVLDSTGNTVWIDADGVGPVATDAATQSAPTDAQQAEESAGTAEPNP